MKQLRDPNHTPPGGWRYIDPDTNYPYREEYSSLEHLLTHVRAYRKQNNLPELPRLQLKVECWLCKQPDMKPYCRNLKRTVSQYISGAVAMAEMAIKGEDGFVDQETADARALVCKFCPENKENRDHGRLRKYTDEFALKKIGKRSTPHDDKLLSCAVCTCVLRLKVHVAPEIILRDINRETINAFPDSSLIGKDGKPVHCWQKHLKS